MPKQIKEHVNYLTWICLAMMTMQLDYRYDIRVKL